MISRRSFLATTGLTGAALVATGRPAAALTYGRVRAEVEEDYRNACRADPSHAGQRAELAAKLAAEGLSEAQAAEILDAATCPVCGCPLRTL